MKYTLYALYAMVLAVVSFFTKEVVTYIMLGMVLLALMNINATLKRILEKMNKQ